MLITAAAITKREPISGGSGIPQVEAELKGKLNARWAQVMIGKFIGGILTVGGGLSLGSEGPSVQLGAMTGKGFSRINQRLKTEEKLLLTCGAGAGLAAAFGAPLAGVVFTLEELHKNFSKEVLLSTMASAITADCISSYLFGLKPVFGFTVASGMPLNRIWMVLILGIVMGVFGVIYNKTTFFVQDVFARFNPFFRKVAVPFVMVMILAFTLPQTLGSGSQLIAPAGQGKFEAGFLLLLLAVKYVSSAISFGSGLPGGTFLPLLVLGALSGRSVHGGLKPYSRIFGEVYRILCHTRNGRIFQRHSEGSYHGDNPHQRDDRHFFQPSAPCDGLFVGVYDGGDT